MEYEAGAEVPPLSLSAVLKPPSESMTSSSSTSSSSSVTSQSGSQSARFQISGRFKTLRRRSESNGDTSEKQNGAILHVNPASPQLVVQGKMTSQSQQPAALIGVPLKDLKKEGNLPYAAIFFVDSLLRLGAEKTNGIFKKNGKFVQVEQLKNTLNSGAFSPAPSDVHVCASVFKLWIRSLPEPLIPADLYEQALKCEIDDEAFALYEKIEEPSKSLIGFICHFLSFLAQDDIRSVTMMNDANLASVFAPCFMKCPYTDVNQMLAAQEKQSNCVLALLDAAKNKLIPDPGFAKVLEASKEPLQDTGSVPTSSASTPSVTSDIPPPSTPPPPIPTTPPPPIPDDYTIGSGSGSSMHRRRSSTKGSLGGHAKSTDSGHRKMSISSAGGVNIPPPPLPNELNL